MSGPLRSSPRRGRSWITADREDPPRSVAANGRLRAVGVQITYPSRHGEGRTVSLQKIAAGPPPSTVSSADEREPFEAGNTGATDRRGKISNGNGLGRRNDGSSTTRDGCRPDAAVLA